MCRINSNQTIQNKIKTKATNKTYSRPKTKINKQTKNEISFYSLLFYDCDKLYDLCIYIYYILFTIVRILFKYCMKIL